MPTLRSLAVPRRTAAGLCAVAMSAMLGCPWPALLTGALNPFQDVPLIPLTGEPHDLTSDLVSLGELIQGQVVRLTVNGPTISAVLILIQDEESGETGILAGGGPPNEAFQYRVQRPRRYFVFVLFDPTADEASRGGTIRAEPGDPDYAPPATQVVQVVFEPDYLTTPGLFDPDSGTPDEQQFLAGISDVVAEGIMDHLRQIFEGSPVEIIGETDPVPAGPFSKLIFSPQRVLAEQQDLIDAALPPADPDRPECQVRVVFGEVLPRGVRQDPGNQHLDDEAVVYVGSFQGRGERCRTAATDSVNNIVLALSQTGAHEIGHLIGLFHVEQVEIMHRSATLAFLRELDFARGQLQIERRTGGELVTEVLTTVIQDPGFYFATNFSAP